MSVKFKIIIADDDEILLRGLTESFDWKQLGIEVVAKTDNGIDALNAVKKFNPDILLTDIRMPQLDGLELIEKVKEYNKEIVVIIMSAHDEFSYAHKAIKLGAEDYLLKPIDLDNFNARFSSIIQNRLLHRDNYQSLNKNIDNHSQRQRMYQDAMIKKYNYSDFRSKYADVLSKMKYSNYTAIGIRCNDSITEPQLIDMNNKIIEIINTNDTNIYEYIIAMDRLILIVASDSEESLSASSKFIKEELHNQMYQDNEMINLTYQNSRVVNNLYDLHLSYADIHNTDDILYITGVDNDIYIENYNITHQEINTIDYSYIRDIISALMQGNDKQLNKYIDKYMLELIKTSKNARIIFTYNLSMMFSTIEANCNKISINMCEIIGDTTKALNDILSYNTLQYGIVELSKKLIQLSQHISLSNDHSINHLMINAYQYIEDNYKNPELRINDVAEYICLSVSYFSMVFKTSSGQNFTNYLIKTRMEAAKYLLLNTNYRSYEISYKVGYNNPTYFSSTFKKYTGYTPSDFIKMNKK